MHSRSPSLLLALSIGLSGSALAQGNDDATEPTTTVSELATMAAVTGYEQGFAATLKASLPGARTDRAGNVVLALGSGTPKRLLACPMDEPGYVVGGVRDDGYLTLRRVGPAPGPLFDQQLEGERVTLYGSKGEVPGVVAVRSVHLTRGRTAADQVFTVDDAYVDVGAASRQEALGLGLSVLSPVTLSKRIHRYGHDLVAAPAIGRKAACAALLRAASRARPGAGTVVVAFVTQQRLGASGLLSVARERGPFDSIVVVNAAPGELGQPPELKSSPLSQLPLGGTVAQLSLPVHFADTPVETVSLGDAAGLEQQLISWIGEADATRTWRGIPMSGKLPGPHPVPAVAEADSILRPLIESYGPSGMERPVRETVKALLPPWAKPIADLAGNLWLDLGKGDPTVVFVAHMDEIGFQVSAIRDDGSLELTQLGGFFPSLFEGRPALVHLNDKVVNGVFLPRDSVGSTPVRTPPPLRIDLGTTSRAATESLGVTTTAAVTMPKQYVRLAGTRATGRSFDDRVGCATLLLAVRHLNPATLRHRVIFVWSVREEVGLEGAKVVADALQGKATRVHAIDTFVSADSPLEPKSFAVAPLGQGPVARALDNSSATPPVLVDSLVALARLGSIPLQVGTTNGGNDGSMFVGYGVPDVAIGWPLRYAHSPAEVIDLKDVANLGRLIRRIAERW
jgi:putative aminopeptidase FrvX